MATKEPDVYLTFEDGVGRIEARKVMQANHVLEQACYDQAKQEIREEDCNGPIDYAQQVIIRAQEIKRGKNGNVNTD